MVERCIGRIEHIPKGEGRNFEVDGLRIAVFHTRGGAVFATQADCPHRAGPLADGLMGDDTVLCPLHDRLFDLKTGQEIGADCALAVYPVRLDADGTIVLRFPAADARRDIGAVVFGNAAGN